MINAMRCNAMRSMDDPNHSDGFGSLVSLLLQLIELLSSTIADARAAAADRSVLAVVAGA